MNSIGAAASVSSPTVDTQSIRTPKEAAKQFEALLLSQLLHSARETSSIGGEDSQRDAVFDMAENNFAQVMASRGGLGLAKLISDGLEKNK